MRSVADDLRRSSRERLRALSPGERVLLAGRLAEADFDLFCRSRGIPHHVGRRVLARRRQAGRRASRVMEPPE